MKEDVVEHIKATNKEYNWGVAEDEKWDGEIEEFIKTLKFVPKPPKKKKKKDDKKKEDSLVEIRDEKKDDKEKKEKKEPWVPRATKAKAFLGKLLEKHDCEGYDVPEPPPAEEEEEEGDGKKAATVSP